MALEETILSNLVYNEEYVRKALVHIKPEYFLDRQQRLIFNLIETYFLKYNALPSREALFIDLSNKTELTEEDFKTCKNIVTNLDIDADTKLDWLIEKTEAFCQEKAIYNAIMMSIKVLDNKVKDLTKGAIPQLLQDALAVSFNTDVGHDFLNDWEHRYDLYHTKEKRLSFNLHYLNVITRGGILAKTLNVLLAGTGVGKAQPLSARIPTPHGWKTMGELKVGDFVFGSDGKFTRILGVYPQGKKQVFELTFVDGRKTRCCKEHLWNVYDTKTDRWTTKSLEQIMKTWSNNGFQKNRTYIQLSDPIDYVKQNLPIDPYVLGVIIGDGSTRGHGCVITTADQEIVDNISTRLPNGIVLSNTKPLQYNIVSSGKFNSVNSYLKMVGLNKKYSYEKTIPEVYKISSIQDRIDLLRGLMDTDGTITKNQAMSYSTTSYQLAKDVAELVYSLGGYAKIRINGPKTYHHKNIKKEGRQSYDVIIRINRSIQPFSISRKLERWKPTYQYNDLKLKIQSIEMVEEEECQCIKVDAENSLYLTDSYIVTHNTLALCHFTSAYLSAGYNVLYITGEMAEERIAERIDANMLDVPVSDLVHIQKEKYRQKIEKIAGSTSGKLIIKEYPTATAHSGHFKALLNELKLKKSFVPDVILIDYLNLFCSSRLKLGAGVNSYAYVKAIAEELRGLAVEYNLPIWTATQTNREGFTSSDVGLENTSESFGLPATADFMLALTVTEELQELGQIMVKQLKNRYSDPVVNRKFMLGIDKTKMRLYDVDQQAQDDLDGGPVMDHGKTMEDLQPSANIFRGFK